MKDKNNYTIEIIRQADGKYNAVIAEIAVNYVSENIATAVEKVIELEKKQLEKLGDNYPILSNNNYLFQKICKIIKPCLIFTLNYLLVCIVTLIIVINITPYIKVNLVKYINSEEFKLSINKVVGRSIENICLQK